MRAVFFMALFLCKCAMYAQRIVSLNLFPTHTSVVIKFTIAAGPSCSGYTVFHGLDSLTYSEIGADPGICGTTSGDEEKSFTHSSPVFNQLNYYKVRLEPYVETSFSKSVFVFSSANANILAFPNPFYGPDNLLHLKISGAENTRLTGSLCNLYGKPLQNLDLYTVGDLASMWISGLENGMYIIRLSANDQTFNCKFLMLR